MWIGSKGQCPTTLVGLVHLLVQGRFLSLLAYTRPNLLRLCPIPPQQPSHSLFRPLPTVKTGVEVIPADPRSLHNKLVPLSRIQREKAGWGLMVRHGRPSLPSAGLSLTLAPSQTSLCLNFGVA